MDHFSKKINIFLWELSLGAISIADWLQRLTVLYFHLSFSVTHMPKSHRVCCSFLRALSLCFCVFGISCYKLLVGRLFFPQCLTILLLCWSVILFMALRRLWLAIIRTFFWTLWGKCNKRLFRDLISSFDRFLDFTLSTVLYWCKSKQLFNHLTLSYLVSN